jgi:hypothetical protein
MISTFFYALITDRTYFINWDEHNPLPLELVWERPYINWTHSPAEMEQVFSQKNRLLGYQKADMLNQKLPILKSFMLPKGGKTDFNQLWNETVSGKF